MTILLLASYTGAEGKSNSSRERILCCAPAEAPHKKKKKGFLTLPLTSSTVRWNVHGKAHNCFFFFFLGIWAKVLITVNKDVDFLSCRKIKKKFSEPPDCAKPGYKQIVSLPYNLIFPLYYLLMICRRQKLLWNTWFPPLSFWKHWKNLHSNLCLFLLIIPEKFIKINMIPCSRSCKFCLGRDYLMLELLPALVQRLVT